MNSSVPPTRRIASNLAWVGGELVRHPLLTLGADGRILSVGVCAEPDRMAATEFYAGVLVPDFPVDYRAWFSSMRTRADRSLPELLTQLPEVTSGVLVVISGLDYATMRLTPRSQIQKL